METICVDQGTVRPNANLYAYVVNQDTFDQVALSWYMCSGKFDKTSLNRWGGEMHKYKAQLLRASIDNTVVFVPVGKTKTSEFEEDLRGHLILLCFRNEETNRTRIIALGIVTRNPIRCPDEYKITRMNRLLPIHIVSTSCTIDITLERLVEFDVSFEQSEHLPSCVHKLSDDIADKVDIDIPASHVQDYERHVIFAHAYDAYLRELEDVETPVKQLELDRKKRVRGLRYHLVHKKGILFPPTRRHGQKKSVTSFEYLMKLHEKYATLFGKILKRS